MYKLQNLKIKDLNLNAGQVEGLPKNPRFIKDERFRALKKSIEDAPEMLALRELIVYDNNGEYVIIAGNMRYRACKEIGYKELPCKILPPETPVEKLREYTIKDNISFGQADWDITANEWDSVELADWGMEINFDNDINFNDINFNENDFFTTEPTNLEVDRADKSFSVKITFDDMQTMQNFREKYEKTIVKEYNAIISVSGGKL